MHNKMVEEQDKEENLRKERNATEINMYIKIIQLFAFLAFVFTLPVTAPMFGANQNDLKELYRLAVPITLITTPVGIYRIISLYSRRKELQEEIQAIENDNQEA